VPVVDTLKVSETVPLFAVAEETYWPALASASEALTIGDTSHSTLWIDGLLPRRYFQQAHVHTRTRHRKNDARDEATHLGVQVVDRKPAGAKIRARPERAPPLGQECRLANSRRGDDHREGATEALIQAGQQRVDRLHGADHRRDSETCDRERTFVPARLVA